MNQQQIGIILIIISIFSGIFVYQSKARDDRNILNMMRQLGGSCFLEDGTCLHEENNTNLYLFGWSVTVAIFVLGVYLVVFDRTQKILVQNQVEISRALKEVRKKETEKDRFDAFLAGFGDDEKKVLMAIRDQDGIQQSTLRYRTGMSKATLSIMLKSFEEREIISRKTDGKTNQVFLRKKF